MLHDIYSMKPHTAKTKTKSPRKSISRKEISNRLADIDLAQTSAIGDLEMDVNGEEGVDSREVLSAHPVAKAPY